MGAKKIQISPDNRTTWYTFPGDKGEIHNEANSINDTIFGQNYKSSQSGLINLNLSCNGYYKGFAGYVATIKKSGTPTTVTGGPMTLVSGKTYKVTDATKNLVDRATAVVVKDNGVTVGANNILSFDYLFGQVTFTSGYTPTGPITMDYKYMPLTQVAKGQSFTLTQTADTIKTSDFETVQANGGYDTFDYGLKTVSLSVKGVYASSNGYVALLQSRAEIVIEIQPSGDTNATARGWFKMANEGSSGNVGELEAEDVNFTLYVPDQASIITPFSWSFSATSTLNRAIREAVLAWQNSTTIDANYLQDGTAGQATDAIVTDVTLAGGLEVMNEFSVKFQGTGAPVAFP